MILLILFFCKIFTTGVLSSQVDGNYEDNCRYNTKTYDNVAKCVQNEHIGKKNFRFAIEKDVNTEHVSYIPRNESVDSKDINNIAGAKEVSSNHTPITLYSNGVTQQVHDINQIISITPEFTLRHPIVPLNQNINLSNGNSLSMNRYIRIGTNGNKFGENASLNNSQCAINSHSKFFRPSESLHSGHLSKSYQTHHQYQKGTQTSNFDKYWLKEGVTSFNDQKFNKTNQSGHNRNIKSSHPFLMHDQKRSTENYSVFNSFCPQRQDHITTPRTIHTEKFINKTLRGTVGLLLNNQNHISAQKQDQLHTNHRFNTNRTHFQNYHPTSQSYNSRIDTKSNYSNYQPIMHVPFQNKNPHIAGYNISPVQTDPIFKSPPYHTKIFYGPANYMFNDSTSNQKKHYFENIPPFLNSGLISKPDKFLAQPQESFSNPQHPQQVQYSPHRSHSQYPCHPQYFHCNNYTPTDMPALQIAKAIIHAGPPINSYLQHPNANQGAIQKINTQNHATETKKMLRSEKINSLTPSISQATNLQNHIPYSISMINNNFRSYTNGFIRTQDMKNNLLRNNSCINPSNLNPLYKQRILDVIDHNNEIISIDIKTYTENGGMYDPSILFCIQYCLYCKIFDDWIVIRFFYNGIGYILEKNKDLFIGVMNIKITNPMLLKN